MGAVADHLWQSTWFALAAWLLALLVRKDAARIRFLVWMTASAKFLFPFALLSWIGNQFILQVDTERALLPIVQQVASPLTSATIPIGPVGQRTQEFLIATWGLVTAALLARLLLSWLHTRSLVRWSIPATAASPIPVRCSDLVAEPGVVGIVDPVLLVPRNLLADLSPEQSNAVIAHEMWHVRRRDNLTAFLHSLTEAVFWFHPMVWWIGARLVREREHACDEAVIEDGNEPKAYAAALLKVCRESIRAPTVCIASATGGDLSARVRGIMQHTDRASHCAVHRFILAAVFLACAALPVASGMTVVVTSALNVTAGTRSIRVSDAAGPAILVMHADYVYGRSVSLRELIGHAYSVHVRDVGGGLRELDYPRYDVELRAPAGGTIDQRQLVADLLEQQFNVELIVRPAMQVRSSSIRP